MRNPVPGTASVLLGVLALVSGASAAPGNAAPGDVREIAGAWCDRVFLVVADGGPIRVPVREDRSVPPGLFRRRRVGCAVYLEDRRFLLTTSSVVGDNTEVEVFSEDGRHDLARIVGRDAHLDLALLETFHDLPGTEGLAPAEGVDAPSTGTPCVILGSPYGHPLMAGLGTIGDSVVIMPTGFPVQVRRVNAPIYPGDSGGPVLDREGRFLGIVTAAFHPDGSGEGAVLEEGGGELAIRKLRSEPAALSGFAVPSRVCEHVWQDLRRHGRVRRGFLGVLMPLDFGTDAGVRVLRVMPGSPADHSGIRPGDLITAFGRHFVTDPRRFCARVAATPPGLRLDVRLLRGQEEHVVTVTIDEATRPVGIQTLVPETPVSGLVRQTADVPSN